MRPPAIGPLRLWPESSSPEEEWIAEHAVRIGPSEVHGRGVFAAMDLPSLRVLSRYHGRLFSSDEIDMLYDSFAPGCPDYLLSVGKGKKLKYVDAAFTEPKHWTALINDPRNTLFYANLEFTTRGRIKTTRRIRAGEELFIDYGSDYDWECHEKKSKAKEKKPVKKHAEKKQKQKQQA